MYVKRCPLLIQPFIHPLTHAPRNWPLPRQLPLLDLGGPALDALAATAHGDIELDVLHALDVGHKVMVAHAARIRPPLRQNLQHRHQEIADPLALVRAEMVFFPQHVRQGPVSQAVDVAQFAFAVENFLRPFSGQAQRFGEGAEELDHLRDVVVVFSVFGAGLRVEKVIASDKLEDLVEL